MVRRVGAEVILIAIAFLAGLAAAAWIESRERGQQAAGWLQEGR